MQHASPSDDTGGGPGLGAPDDLDQFLGPNAGYILELFERYQQDPRAVDLSAREMFARWRAGRSLLGVGQPPEGSFDIPAAAAAADLALAIRLFGHLAARLDPLGSPPPGDPQLAAEAHRVDEDDLRRLPAGVVSGPAARGASNAAAAIHRLREIYCGRVGYEFAQVTSHEERTWLQDAVEERRFWPPADPVDERGLLDRLTELSAFERFLHQAYPARRASRSRGWACSCPCWTS
jgi:2-oxoglutarate dehydrogenase E1 component